MVIPGFTWRTAFASVLCAATLLAGCDAPPTESAARHERVHLVETAPVVSDNLNLVRTRTGTLRAHREVRIHAQEEGIISALPVYEGDRIERGDLIARLDDTLLRAQLARARATLKQARQDLKRLKELRGRQLVSEDEYTRAQTQLEIAEADERVLLTRLGYTEIRSPLNGVVVARNSEPGSLVQRLQHLATIVDPSSLMTELPVSELVIPDLRVGDSASVRIDALGDEVFKGRIRRIHPSLDAATRRGIVEVELDPVPPGAAPGQLCRVELVTHASRRIVIPFSALRRDALSEYVFVLDGDNKAQRVDVRSGLRLAENVEITAGLEAGQRVITRGFLDLTAGKTVKPVNIVSGEG